MSTGGSVIWICRCCGAKTAQPAGKRPPVTGWSRPCPGNKTGIHKWVK